MIERGTHVRALGARQTPRNQLVEQIQGIVPGYDFEHLREGNHRGNAALLRHACDVGRSKTRRVACYDHFKPQVKRDPVLRPGDP